MKKQDKTASPPPPALPPAQPRRQGRFADWAMI